MILVEESTVPKAVLPVALFKNYMRLGSGFSDDGLQDDVLETSLRSALAAIEARTGKFLIQREVTWTLTKWRDPCAQVLPVAPVASVLSVALVGQSGETTAWPAKAWHVERDAHQPRLVATGGALPSIPHAGSVKIRLKAGYGESWEDIPAGLSQAVLTLAAHFYEFRYDAQGTASRFPSVIESLVAPFIRHRLTGGYSR